MITLILYREDTHKPIYLGSYYEKVGSTTCYLPSITKPFKLNVSNLIGIVEMEQVLFSILSIIIIKDETEKRTEEALKTLNVESQLTLQTISWWANYSDSDSKPKAMYGLREWLDLMISDHLVEKFRPCLTMGSETVEQRLV